MYISTFRICVYEMYNICSACLALVVCVCWSGVARSLQPGVGLGLPLMMYNVTDSEDYLLYRLSVLIVWGDTKEIVCFEVALPRQCLGHAFEQASLRQCLGLWSCCPPPLFWERDCRKTK